MASASASVVLLLFKASLLGLLFHDATAVTTHTVGGNGGWIVPGNDTFYKQWADGQTFSVGDTLLFNFQSGTHDVVEVSRSDYESCTNNTIGTFLTNGPASVTLETAGTHYYICAFPGHCLGGQKLAVDVTGSASSTPANGPSANAPTGSQPPPESSSPPSVLGVVVPAASAAVGLAALLL